MSLDGDRLRRVTGEVFGSVAGTGAGRGSTAGRGVGLADRDVGVGVMPVDDRVLGEIRRAVIAGDPGAGFRHVFVARGTAVAVRVGAGSGERGTPAGELFETFSFFVFHARPTVPGGRCQSQ